MGRGATAIVLALSMAGCASTPSPATAIARAEEAFSADAATNGVKVGFLDALDEGAVLFRPGPLDGRAFIASHDDPPIVLAWRPQLVVAASSGDVGMSTGPWRATARDGAGEPSHGQFFTVWNKNRDGAWRVRIDHGIDHPNPAGWDAPLVTITADGSRPAEPMIDAEARFDATSARSGVDAAYRAFASPRMRSLRDGAAPGDPVVATQSSWSWTPIDSGVARSGDLGWVLGSYRAAGPATGHFVRVWRSEGGAWKIAGDVLAPTPGVIP